MSDPLDVLTVPEAREAINVESSAVDLLLPRLVTAVSRVIDRMCGPVVQRTITDEIHDGGKPSVRLRRYPVASVTEVLEARFGSTSEVSELSFGQSGDGFFAPTWSADPSLLSGDLKRFRSGVPIRWWAGPSGVKVTYVAGRYATTAAVDARFKHAAQRIVRDAWKRESPTWAQSSDVLAAINGELDAAPSFFRSVEPAVREWLWEDCQTKLVGFA